jgi:RNA polymerase sigma factor (sigma-70 family)
MSTSPSDLAPLIRKQLAHFVRKHPSISLEFGQSQAAHKITRIIRKNIRSGRYERYRHHQRAKKKMTVAVYAETIIGFWIQDAPRWQRLRNNDTDAWNSLRAQLVNVARKMIQSIRLNTGDQAEDYADRACIQILNADYPFDVPFDAWLYTILQRVILDRQPRKDPLARASISLDRPISKQEENDHLQWEISDGRADSDFEAVEQRDLLERALAALTPLRRTVIFFSFLEEKTDGEIAEDLGISRGNVQTIRHRALVQLSHLIEDNSMSVTRRRRHQDKESTKAHKKSSKREDPRTRSSRRKSNKARRPK